MTVKTFDTVILGQGLAGTVLAWCLRARGQQVGIIDEDRPSTTSKVSAGLITPITGQRLAFPWYTEAEFQIAKAFYEDVETSIGARLFTEHRAARIFVSEDQQAIWEKRRNDPRMQSALAPAEYNPLPTSIINAPLGGFQMRGARLDVARFIALSRSHFDVTTHELDWSRDVTFHDDRVDVCTWHARRLIACQGHSAQAAPFFQSLPFKASKGEILTVRLAQPMPAQSIHADIWLAPTAAPHVFRAGSTSDWHTLDNVPTDKGRQEIEAKLAQRLRVPFEVIAHEAGVRPNMRAMPACVGMHPNLPRLGIFNGLGAKGALRAPLFARMLTAHMLDGAPLSSEADAARRVTS